MHGANGPQPISASDILAYCTLRNIHKDDDLDAVLWIVPILDGLWMEDWYKREKARQDAAAGGKTGKRY